MQTKGKQGSYSERSGTQHKTDYILNIEDLFGSKGGGEYQNYSMKLWRDN